MLFRKKIEKRCEYCAYSAKLEEDQVLCAKRGLQSAYDRCGKFRYDPTKRIPLKPKALDFDQYRQEDFTLSNAE